jgi:hypothetical protein
MMMLLKDMKINNDCHPERVRTRVAGEDESKDPNTATTLLAVVTLFHEKAGCVLYIANSQICAEPRSISSCFSVLSGFLRGGFAVALGFAFPQQPFSVSPCLRGDIWFSIVALLRGGDGVPNGRFCC